MDGKTIRNKLVGSDDERAVSPVIGVILMVAITVILAAVIATLVMDFGDNVNEEAQAAVTIDTSSSEASITWTSEGNAESLSIDMSSSDCSWNTPPSNVGETTTFSPSSPCDTQSGTITVSATTEDGTTTAVQTADYDFS